MLINNLVIYTKKPFEDSEGRVILHGFPVAHKSDHFVAQSKTEYNEPNSGAMRFDFATPIFNSLELVSPKKRLGGAKNHQVLIPLNVDNHFIQCDIRDEVINDIMYLEGVEKGKIKGDFTFFKHGAQVELTLVGSKEYHSHLEATQLKAEVVKIANSQLKVGYGYASPKGEVEVFLGKFYQNGYSKFGESKKIDTKPTLFHFFAILSEKGNHISIKRTQRFNYETPEPIVTVEEANTIMGEFVKKVQSELEDTLNDLGKVYTKHYKAFLEDATRSKEYHVIKAKGEARKLVNRAYDLYRQQLTNADKSMVNYDKDAIYELVYSRLNEDILKVKTVGFF